MPTLQAAFDALVGPTGRCAGALAQAGIKVAAPGDIADAVGEGLAFCGVAAADPGSPTDADVANLPNAEWRKFLDVAELRLVETCWRSLIGGGTSKRWSSYQVTRDVKSVGDTLRGLRESVRMKWGYGVAPVAAGVVDLGLAPRPLPGFYEFEGGY